MDYDEILRELGDLGKHQITTYILVCLPIIFSGANSFSYVFTAGIPRYRCFVPECETVQTSVYDDQWVKWAIPEENSDHCNRFVVNEDVANGTCFEGLFTNQTETCNEWVFDLTEHTLVNEWNLTCLENQWKLSFVGTCQYAGDMVGTVLCGILADRFGRKRVFITCLILMSLFGSIQVLSPNYATFVILKFLQALSSSGIYATAFIICVEMARTEKREMAGIIQNYFFSVGEAALAFVAWYTKNWVSLQLTLSAPALLFGVYFWIIPESVRWLLANKRRKEAKRIVCQTAKANNVVLSHTMLASFDDETSSTDGEEQEDGSIFLEDILKRRKFATRLMIIYFIWFATAFVYYGLSLTSTSLNGNKYVNFALVSLVEIPACSIAWVGIKKGRRWSLIGSLLLCGLTCALAAVLSDTAWVVGILFLTGKSGATSAFAVVYIYTAELLPTVIRAGGVTSASTVARVGALLAPFVPMLGIYAKQLPMFLFGGLAVVAGVFASSLPETLGTGLPETLDEAENLSETIKYRRIRRGST